MSGRLILALAALLGFGLAKAAVSAEPADTVARTALRVCADPANLPFSNDKGEGFENKIASLFADRLGLPLEYVFFPDTVGFVRNTLRARRCDLVMGSVASADQVQSTAPYYRSAYVMLTRTADGIDADRIDTPALRGKKIGLIARTPPATVIAQAGMAAQIHPYPLFVDTRIDAPGADMVADLLAGQIDVALLWGPIAGHHAARHEGLLRMTPLLHESSAARMDYYITMAVRPGEDAWRSRVNALINGNQAAINAILQAFHVPLLDVRGALIPAE